MRSRNGWGGLPRIGRVAATLVVVGWTAACEVPTDLPRLESTFVVPTEQLTLPVAGQPVSVLMTHDMAQNRNLVSRTRGGTLVVEIENGASAMGRIDLRVSNGQVDVMASLDARGENVQRIPLTRVEIQSLLGSMVTLRASGTLCPAAGCGTSGPAGQVVRLRGRFELVLDTAADS